MLFNSTKLTLANTMMIGVIMTICSNNWLSMWMGLEISLLSFIPFMQTNKISSESMMKYFIMQSMASSLLLFSVIYMLIGVNILNEMILTISMLIKLGSAPFHNWVLMIIEMIDYLSMFVLLTILKIPPLLIIFQLNSKMLNIPIMYSMIISSISCLNQSSMRKTLGYSSIYNLSLMLVSINKFNVTMFFMLIYSLTLIMIVFTLKVMKISFINQMVSNEFSIWLKLNMWINILSLSGFPPLMGFLGKLVIVQNMISMNQNTMLVILLTTSIFVTMFYTRLAFSSILTLYSFKKWTIYKNKPMHYIMALNFFSTPMVLSCTSML